MFDDKVCLSLFQLEVVYAEGFVSSFVNISNITFRWM